MIVGELHLQPFQKVNIIVLCTDEEEIWSPFTRLMQPLDEEASGGACVGSCWEHSERRSSPPKQSI